MSDTRAMTDEQQDFRRSVLHDAYTAVITKMYAQAWASGYDAAKRDVQSLGSPGPIERGDPRYDVLVKLDESSFGDLMDRAARELVGVRDKSEREFITGLATLGRSFGAPPL